MANDSGSTETNGQAGRFPIVGIGASAGGLEASLAFLAALPAKTGMAFVLVQHLEPSYESHLPEILSRGTAMPVLHAQDNTRIDRDRLYVIPPNAMMTIEQGVLRLSPRAESPNPHYPIDKFLVSLAGDQGSYAVGIILSGSSSDGAQGLRAVKCAAGTTFCQDEESAKYGSMPHSAIATGAVDFVLPPRAIAQELVRIAAHPYLNLTEQNLTDQTVAPHRPDTAGDAIGESREEIRKILLLLRRASGVDFTQYKENTIRRRIARRMLVNNCADFNEYVAHLERQPAELADLYRDILISVTQFFREPEIFSSLAFAASKLLEKRDSNAPFRIWCAGCATGEEAYSLAIVIREILNAFGQLSTPIQLFGTDISEFAIDRARAADYPESIQSDVSPERLNKFFTRTDTGYRIAKQIRESCIFARHDLIKDPPFSQLDVVSCRNVLIYLDSPAQQRILPALHYSLKPEGLLVLGSAESVGNRTDLFTPVENDKKIFSKRPAFSRFSITTPDLKRSEEAPIEWKAKELVPKELIAPPPFADVEARATRILRDIYAPPGVTVNDSLQIVHFHGRTSPYLEPPTGEASLNLLRVAHQSLLFPIRKAIDTASEKMQPVQETGVRLERGGEAREITLRVIPISEGGSRFFLVLFEEGFVRPAPPLDLDDVESSVLEFQLAQARRELDESREYLRKIVEQHEVAIEELRAAHEEVQSSNEEMQSTNEELRTAKEELQSSNEELRTVNDELQNRNNELGSVNNDLSNVLNAVSIPIVMVGMDFRIRRYTPAAARLLNSMPTDVGRAITEVHYAFEVPGLHAMLTNAIETLAVQQTRIQNREGRWFSVQVRPYRTVDDRIDGAVVTFLDIDEVTRALETAEASRDFAEGMVETVQHPLLVLDHELHIQRVTSGFYRDFRTTPNETLGQSIFDVGSGQWNSPLLRKKLETALLEDVPFRDLTIEYDFPKIGRRTMRLNAQRISGRDRNSHTLLLAIEDVTERKEAAEIQYRRLFESAKDGIVVVDGSTGLVVDANPFFLELTRYSRKEIVGFPFWEIPPFRKAEEGRRVVPETTEKEVTQFDAVRVQAQDGRQLLVAMIANRYRVKDQTFIQVNLRDVTQRRQAEDDLRRSNLDLQQFAFAASHDLQEPLRTVINQVELLQKEYKGKLGADADEIIQFITTATDRMRQMILDLLNYSQIARASIIISATSMEAVLATAMSNLQLAIVNSGARITFDPLPTVWMDQTQAIQLLQNLIGNALKYHSAEPPHIHLSGRQVGNEWIVSVKDNGLGIEPRFHQHIFTVFKRLHGREYPGTGIGLATCNRIVERHGGRIWVESELGKGSTFFFSVPIPS
ncbi:MAG TPA: CheR family methyltransferase [Bryobacteraceae bacterium]|nr:CheR family methyltransferase [Bryobacteraceae bacterium]